MPNPTSNVSKLNFNNVEQMKKYTQSYTGGLADSCWAYAVGTPSEEVKNLMDVTKEAMYKGIEQAVVGNRIGDIGAAIQEYAESRGYGVVRDWLVMVLAQLCTKNQWFLTMALLVVGFVSVKEWS